jgi:uncharacterized protein YebE (UPF0316 family)
METLDAVFSSPWGPIIICLLRIIDVSLATVRIMLLMQGVRWLVPLIAFVEVLVWIFTAGSVIQNLQSVWHLVGYAGGFAAGNVVGMWVEEKLAFGFSALRIVSSKPSTETASMLRERGCGVTQYYGRGKNGDVEVTFTVVRRRDLPAILSVIREKVPDSFITVEETKSVVHGWLFFDRRHSCLSIDPGGLRRA